jgi:nitrite reductase/ring-hydroxylating ferredoxin subunit
MVLVKLLEVDSVPINSHRYVIVNERELMIFNFRNEFFCYDARCSHAGAPLFEGEIEGDVIVCPWHDARFRIADGSVVDGPATESLKSYPIIIKDNFLYVDTADF